jgi:hypothetical protein
MSLRGVASKIYYIYAQTTRFEALNNEGTKPDVYREFQILAIPILNNLWASDGRHWFLRGCSLYSSGAACPFRPDRTLNFYF